MIKIITKKKITAFCKDKLLINFILNSYNLFCKLQQNYGAPARIEPRTSLVRSQALYPVELQALINLL